MHGPDDDFISAALSDAALASRLLAAQPALPYAGIHAACAAGDADAAAKLLGTGAVSVAGFGGPKRWPPILYLCYSRLNSDRARQAGFARCAELLLERAADPNASHVEPQWPDSPQSALYGAVGVNCNPELARVLVANGARMDDGESIYHAAQHNHVACLEVLAEHGADFSARQLPWHNTPLYFLAGTMPDDAAWETALAGMRWLLEHGADPNVASTELKETPLHRVAGNHDASVVGLLLDHGADASLRDALDTAPYQIAARYGNAGVLEEFRRRGVEFELGPLDRLLAACAAGDTEHARGLLEGEPGLLDKVIQTQGSLITELAGRGNTAAVQAFLALGVPPGIRALECHTPLHSACWRGQLETARVLVAAGAPLDLRDKDYDGTPLDWVCHGSLNAPGHEQKDYAALARLLLEAGAPKLPAPWGSADVQAVLRGG